MFENNYRAVKMQDLGSVMGMPIGVPAKSYGFIPPPPNPTPPPLEMPGAGLSRCINYFADYAGCGWWRMISPELLLNINNRCISSGMTTMVTDPRFYGGVKSVRLQRQATPIQLEFLKFLRQLSQKMDFKIIYEIDDIVLRDDIPDYNRCKTAFESDEVYNSIIEMMGMVDEMSVTCQFMKNYYEEKTGNKNITVIPNYPAKMWMDGYYDIGKINKDFNQNRKKPRIAYIGSGTHIDVANKTNQKDDFEHVVKNIISTVDEFQWVFIGGFPLQCKPFIDRGEIEFIQWFPLLELGKAYHTTNIQAVIAPLRDNNFNRAKSNIKYLEASCCGIPGVFQDLVTYKDAPIRFDKGDDMIDKLKHLLSDEGKYMEHVVNARRYADGMWLDDHLDEYMELYFTNIGDENRKFLLKNNPIDK